MWKYVLCDLAFQTLHLPLEHAERDLDVQQSPLDLSHIPTFLPICSSKLQPDDLPIARPCEHALALEDGKQDGRLERREAGRERRLERERCVDRFGQLGVLESLYLGRG